MQHRLSYYLQLQWFHQTDLRCRRPLCTSLRTYIPDGLCFQVFFQQVQDSDLSEAPPLYSELPLPHLLLLYHTLMLLFHSQPTSHKRSCYLRLQLFFQMEFHFHFSLYTSLQTHILDGSSFQVLFLHLQDSDRSEPSLRYSEQLPLHRPPPCHTLVSPGHLLSTLHRRSCFLRLQFFH